MQDWIIEFVRSAGPVGVAGLMLLENVFPPIPSELIMPLAGFLSESGGMSLTWAIVGGTLGSVAGAAFWYVIGRRMSEDRLRAWATRHGAWVAMTPEDIDRGKDWFQRHRRRSVLIGRLVPVVRTVVSVPAGFSRMNVFTFLAYSTIGTAAWNSGLAVAGHVLRRRFPAVQDWVGPIAWTVIGGMLAWYVYRVVKLRHSE